MKGKVYSNNNMFCLFKSAIGYFMCPYEDSTRYIQKGAVVINIGTKETISNDLYKAIISQ